MIPTHDFISKPYDDEVGLVYDFDEHRYKLNVDYSIVAVGNDELINDIGGLDNLKWVLDHMSKSIYEAFLFYKDSKYLDKTLYYLSHSKVNRKTIKKALVDILIYTEQDGGLYTAYATGLNFNEMAKIDMTLINYIGQMANTIIVNNKLAEHIILWDLDRLTSEYETRTELLDYMETKGYLTASDYYDETTLIPNSSLYKITSDPNTSNYIFYEFNQFESILAKKGSEW